MYALYNPITKKFYRGENEWHNCYEVDTFIEAKTFKTLKDARYENCLIKNDDKVVTFDDAKEMNKLQ